MLHWATDLLPLAEGSVISFGGHFVAKMAAHIFAFLVFMWVLRRYAFGPLTAILDARREGIAQELDRVERLRTEAQAIEAEVQNRLKDIDQEARQRLNEAVAEGRRVKDEIIERARQEAEEQRLKQQRLLELEVAKARIELRDDVARLTVAATEKLLRENLDSDRQRRLVTDFITQVQGLPKEQN